MSGKVNFTLDVDNDNDYVVCTVTYGPELAGHDALFQVVTEVKVKDSSPVHKETVVYEENFRTGVGTRKFVIPRNKLRVFSYEGSKIEINIHTRVKVDDAVFFDTRVSEEQQIRIGTKPMVNNVAQGLIEPKDIYSFFENLKAIPPHNQLITIAIIVIGGIFALVSLVVGVHDQLVSQDSMTWVFSQYNSDGESQDPIAGGGVISVFSTIGVWLAVRYQLRKYMKFGFNLSSVPAKLLPDKGYKVSSFISGKSRVPLKNISLRIVACNMEKGQYVRGSGSNRRTVSFANPIRGVKLYEKEIDHIPAGIQIRDYFNDEITFTPMFETLYPPCMAGDTHGIDVYWEIQLLHPEFVDQEIRAPTSHFQYEHFLKG